VTLLQTLRHSREKRFLLITASVAFLAIGASQAIYGPFYAVFREIFDLSAARVALTTTFHFAGGTASLIVTGFLVRRLGGVRVMIVAAITLTLGFVVISLAPGFPVLLLGALIVGLGFGGLQVLNFMVARIFLEHRGAALNLLNSMFSIGAILAPLAAAPFVLQGSYRPLFVILAVLGLVVIVLVSLQPRRLGYEAAGRSGGGFAGWPFLLTVVGFTLFYLVYVGAEASFTNWIPTHLSLTHGLGFSAQMAGLFWAALTLGRLLMIPVSDRISPAVLVTMSVGIAGLISLAARIPDVAPFAYLLAGFFMGPIFPGGLAWIAQRFPENSTQVSAFVLAGGGFGAVVFPPAIGSMVDAVDPSIIPVAISFVLGAALATALVLRLSGGRRRRVESSAS